jgi:hypothetical protein
MRIESSSNYSANIAVARDYAAAKHAANKPEAGNGSENPMPTGSSLKTAVKDQAVESKAAQTRPTVDQKSMQVRDAESAQKSSQVKAAADTAKTQAADTATQTQMAQQAHQAPQIQKQEPTQQPYNQEGKSAPAVEKSQHLAETA